MFICNRFLSEKDIIKKEQSQNVFQTEIKLQNATKISTIKTSISQKDNLVRNAAGSMDPYLIAVDTKAKALEKKSTLKNKVLKNKFQKKLKKKS